MKATRQDARAAIRGAIRALSVGTGIVVAMTLGVAFAGSASAMVTPAPTAASSSTPAMIDVSGSQDQQSTNASTSGTNDIALVPAATQYYSAGDDPANSGGIELGAPQAAVVQVDPDGSDSGSEVGPDDIELIPATSAVQGGAPTSAADAPRDDAPSASNALVAAHGDTGVGSDAAAAERDTAAAAPAGHTSPRSELLWWIVGAALVLAAGAVLVMRMRHASAGTRRSRLSHAEG